MAYTTKATVNYDALLTHTADMYYKSGVIHDGVFESNPTFNELYKKRFRKVVGGGGNTIQVSLMYGKNTTVGSFSRYEELDNTPQDGFTIAYYPWAEYAGTAAIDGLSEFQNSGTPAIQKLLRSKVEQLTMSFAEKMNEHLFDIEGPATQAAGGTGNSNKNIIGIPLYVQGAPTGALDVGGINQSAETWWANQTANSGTETSGTWSMLNNEMRHMWNTCSRGAGGGPDILVSNQGVHEAYEAGMDSKTRYTSHEDATIGFPSINYKGAKFYWDHHVGDPDGGYNFDNASYADATGGAIYFLNSKFMELLVGKGKDFAPVGFQASQKQDARVGRWIFYGQLVCSNRRKLGVLEDISSYGVLIT